MFAISRLSRNLSPLQAVAGLVSIDSTHEDFDARRDELLTTKERAQRKAMLAQSGAGLLEAIRLEYEGLEQSREVYRKLRPPRDLPLIALAAFNGFPNATRNNRKRFGASCSGSGRRSIPTASS